MTLFDTYLMVDWSASSTPVTGENSIWYCLVANRSGRAAVARLENPATRDLATRELRDLLTWLCAQGLRTLVGFDFAFAYPAGFAAALGTRRTPWRGVWDTVAQHIIDGADNRNNRFKVAAHLNQTLSGAAYPYWGCPTGLNLPYLSPRRPHAPPTLSLPEYRTTESRVRGMHSVWKLAYPGAVGGQTLMGLPRLRALCADRSLNSVSRVWPFETGLRPVPDTEPPVWRILYAEVYPSLVRARAGTEEPKDRAQVRELALHFAARDREGELGALLGGPDMLPAQERTLAEREEGWVLGIR